MRRPWIVVLTSFALVMGLGGIAFAVGGVNIVSEPKDEVVSANREAELPDIAADVSIDKPADDTEKDELEKDEAEKDELEKDEAEKDEAEKDELEKDEAEKDELEKDEAEKDEAEKDEAEKDELEKDEAAVVPAPELVILHPKDGSVVDDEKIVFEGEATPGARVFAGKWEADVNDEGGWRIVLFLAPGANLATLHAESAGGVAQAKVTVTRVVEEKDEAPKDEKPKDEEPKDEGPEFELVAHQVYGVCEEDVPYDVFWGETKPGASVLVWSEYGSAETVANGDGQFEVKVFFPDAPYGKEFAVKVKSIEQKVWFEFTSYANPPAGEGEHSEGEHAA